jgi:hypothetical protein
LHDVFGYTEMSAKIKRELALACRIHGPTSDVGEQPHKTRRSWAGVAMIG